VKGGHLEAGGVEELRTDGVKDGMSELVTEDVGTLARVDGLALDSLVEEGQPAPVVVGIEVPARIQVDGKRVTQPPAGPLR
jgi:hypothetical protein